MKKIILIAIPISILSVLVFVLGYVVYDLISEKFGTVKCNLQGSKYSCVVYYDGYWQEDFVVPLDKMCDSSMRAVEDLAASHLCHVKEVAKTANRRECPK